MEPETRTYTPPGGPDRSETAPEAASGEDSLDPVLDDFSARWRGGDHRGVGDDLREHPSLAADPVAAAALIYREFTLRREAGESVGLDDFQQRYPDYADALARFAEAERLVGPSPPRLGP